MRSQAQQVGQLLISREALTSGVLAVVVNASHGSRCAYITDNSSCTEHHYNPNTSTTVHLYYPITIPLGQIYLTLSFKAKLKGEYADLMEVFLVPRATSIMGGQPLNSYARLFKVLYDSDGYEPEAYVVSPTNWVVVTHHTCSEPGDYYLVFTWRNDNSLGLDPPIVLDEVSLTASAVQPDPGAALGSGVTVIK
ncbi:MAG: hypothetical protein RMJ66_00215 [Bacteroidia bacterium]|nr:hypothetical protein [Bacteroidia bacterium]MDW8133467.1 hypothetical protein [Bacteroidia bacterium]